MDRLLALLGIMTISAIMFSSDVGLNFYIQNDILENVIALMYIGLLGGLVINPSNKAHHLILPIVGLMFWSGRAAGFVDLILTETNTELWGAVAERLYIAALLMYWHYWSVHRIQTEYLRSQVLMLSCHTSQMGSE